jgi:hypothetical protein
MHAYHEQLPNFNPNAILHEGCEECESRANIAGLLQLDWRNAQRAVERAIEWNYGRCPDTNPTEAGLLRAVWSMLVFLERHTELDPIQSGLPWRDFESMEARLGL